MNPINSVWLVTNHTGASFRFTVLTDWQASQPTIEDAVRWSFPYIGKFTVYRLK